MRCESHWTLDPTRPVEIAEAETLTATCHKPNEDGEKSHEDYNNYVFDIKLSNLYRNNIS